MNQALVQLLAACGVPNPRETIGWRRLLLVNNVAGVPTDHAEGDVIANRGFNVLVLDDDGHAALFCKCRPADAGWSAPTSLTARLSRVPELATIVPYTWSVHTETMDAEVSRYTHGDLLALHIRSMSVAELRAALAGIIDAAATLSFHAGRLEPQLIDGPREVALHEIAPWIIDTLIEAGLDPALARILDAALAGAGTVRRALQHGDLWPRNAIVSDGRWHILDFEQMGRVQVPLYDALHLVRTSWDARRRRREDPRAWLDELIGSSEDSIAYRETLAHAAQRVGLTSAQAGGALVYYVADFAARMHRRCVPHGLLAPYLFEAERLANWIDAGHHPEDLFAGSLSGGRAAH